MDSDTRSAYLDYRAKCEQAFTPFAPIKLPDFFAGRLDVINDVDGELRTPGRHVAIYGERGVGKTSLAALLAFFSQDFSNDHVYFVRCSKDSSFASICGDLIVTGSRSLQLDEFESGTTKEAAAKLGSLGVSGSRRSSLRFRAHPQVRGLTPALMIRLFGSEKSLLVVDEYDRVSDPETNVKIAELIKQFSDARTVARIVVVGVAETLTQLVGEHESLSRSLAQVRLQRMSPIELIEIIEKGEDRTGAHFDRKVKQRVVALADGFPHFVHLLCLYASLRAGEVLLEGAKRRVHVGDIEYAYAIERAVSKSEHSLTEAYEKATATTRIKSDIYSLTLSAVAMADESPVQVQALARNASILVSQPLKPSKFSSALGKLVGAERGQVLEKIRDGFYKFRNPLMRAYVRLLVERENIIEHDGQIILPFMRTNELSTAHTGDA